MNNLEDKKIYKNRLYAILTIAFFIILLICGVFVLTLDAKFFEAAPKRRPPEWIWMNGVIVIIFCLAMIIYLIKKLFDDSPDLILKQNGIWLPKFGIVPWNDVEEVKPSQSQTYTILICMKEPNNYMNIGNILQRYSNRNWFKNCGTPVVVSTLLLNINHNILLDIVKKYHKNSITAFCLMAKS